MYRYLLMAILVMGVMLSSSLAEDITATATVPTSFSVTFSYDAIDYGTVLAGTVNNQVSTYRPFGGSTFVPYVSGALNVTVNTNTEYQFTIESTDFVSGSNTILASNHKFNALLGYTTSQYGTITEPSVFLTLQGTRIFGQTITSAGIYYDYHFYRLDVPSGTLAGSYSATVTITYYAI